MTDQQQLAASLIIPTYRREESLVACLECALAQEYSPLEILVIDQTEKHTDETLAALEAADDRIRWIPHSPPSPTTARNLGLYEAGGDVLIFIDDDTTYGPDFVAAHVAAYHRGAEVVQGRVVEPGRGVADRPQWMRPWLRIVGSNTHDRSGVTNTLTGCNFSISREAARQVGDFDTRFSGSVLREDADYGARCHKAGLSMVFDADACLTHHRDSVGGVDADVKEAARVFESSVLRNELYFAHKHFNRLIVWQYKKRIARRIRRAERRSGTKAPAPIDEMIQKADREALELLGS